MIYHTKKFQVVLIMLHYNHYYCLIISNYINNVKVAISIDVPSLEQQGTCLNTKKANVFDITFSLVQHITSMHLKHTKYRSIPDTVIEKKLFNSKFKEILLSGPRRHPDYVPAEEHSI